MVAIILIIAAIALPNLIRSRILPMKPPVNSIRTMTTAAVTYGLQCPSVGYPGTIADMGPGGGGCTGGANILDDVLGVAAPIKAGYSFTYAPAATGGLNTTYTLNANPINPGNSGQRGFYFDQTD